MFAMVTSTFARGLVGNGRECMLLALMPEETGGSSSMKSCWFSNMNESLKLHRNKYSNQKAIPTQIPS